MPKFRVPGPKKVVPVLLAVKQVEDLDKYSAVSGLSRNELIRRAVALFFEELQADEVCREEYERSPGLGFRDEGCRPTALLPNLRFRLPHGIGSTGKTD